MRVRMLTSISGTPSLVAGDETETFSDDEVERLVAKGFAEKVEPVKKQRKKKGETHAEDLGGEQR